MEEEITEYLKDRKIIKAARNSTEFLKRTSDEQQAASESLVVKDFQRSVIAVNEIEAPPLAFSAKANGTTLEAINEQRVGMLESLLKVSRKDSTASLSERIKVLEDKVLWIEEHFPQVAFSCFDYTQDKGPEKKGRIAHYKEYTHPTEASRDTEADTGKEIMRRMQELQKKLKKN